MLNPQALPNAELDRDIPARDRGRRFILFGELRESESKSWLVHGLLGAGEASALYGAPGCGKSVAAEDMGLHIAAGWEWFGRPVTRGAVVYVALERHKLVERRAIAFRKRHGLQDDLPFAIVPGVHDMRDPRASGELVVVCREVEEATGERVVLIIMDTLSRALAGGDENSPKDMGAIVNATGRLQQATQAHVLWVHHIPHESDRLRGHGALLGAMDTTLHVAKARTSRSATVVKANDSEEGERVQFELESVQIADDGTTAPIVVASSDATAARAPVGEPKLTKNQRTAFGILHDTGSAGLTTDEWSDRLREAGIGIQRRADLNDLRRQLKSKALVKQFGDRWTVDHT